MFIFELQALGDLMMRILLYNEHQEYKLGCKEKIYFRVLIVLNGLCIYDVHFEMYVMSKRNPKIFIFVYEMLCHWSTSEMNLAAMICRQWDM